VDASAVITSGRFRLRTQLNPLQAAEIAASKYGFFDVDLKDNDPGNYTVVATAPNRTVRASGKTLEQAVERLLEVFKDD